MPVGILEKEHAPAGKPHSEELKMVPGPLKRVWRTMDRQSLQYVNLEKPGALLVYYILPLIFIDRAIQG